MALKRINKVWSYVFSNCVSSGSDLGKTRVSKWWFIVANGLLNCHLSTSYILRSHMVETRKQYSLWYWSAYDVSVVRPGESVSDVCLFHFLGRCVFYDVMATHTVARQQTSGRPNNWKTNIWMTHPNPHLLTLTCNLYDDELRSRSFKRPYPANIDRDDSWSCWWT